MVVSVSLRWKSDHVLSAERNSANSRMWSFSLFESVQDSVNPPWSLSTFIPYPFHLPSADPGLHHVYKNIDLTTYKSHN